MSRRSESDGKAIPPPSLPLCNSKDSTRQKRARASATRRQRELHDAPGTFGAFDGGARSDGTHKWCENAHRLTAMRTESDASTAMMMPVPNTAGCAATTDVWIHGDPALGAHHMLCLCQHSSWGTSAWCHCATYFSMIQHGAPPPARGERTAHCASGMDDAARRV